MNNQFNNEEELLTRLIRNAGDPSVSPGPQYAEKLRAMILDRLSPAEPVAQGAERNRNVNANPVTIERVRKMKRLTKLAVAASLLVAVGILVSWIVIGGGSTNIAFAEVAKALDNLRSATFDMTTEVKAEKDQPPVTSTGKGFFLAPSHQRIETTVDMAEHTMNLTSRPGELVTIPKTTFNTIMIIDGQTAKGISLNPTMKFATRMDMRQTRENMKKSAKLSKNPPADVFEMVQRLVREGSSGTGEKAEKLGKKKIDGREAVGFRVNVNRMDMTVWADPETACPIRIEVDMGMMDAGRVVINNFRYDVELDPSLFSLEPPEGYSTVSTDMTTPVEEDLIKTLRMIAEHSKGVFPAKLGTNKEVMVSLMVEVDKPTQDKMNAEMNKIMEKVAAKYGGEEKLREKYGKDKKLPPEIIAEIMAESSKALAPLQQELMQKNLPLQQKRMQGIIFYEMLNPENDSHYAGKDVKLGTPDRPILWYKPTGAEKYRVIYADLSVKDMTPDEVKNLPEAKAK